MEKENIKKIIEYWHITAKHDYETMLLLFKGKRYSDSLFFGHIVLEKVLKGMAVKETEKEAPYVHDLIRLVKIAKYNLPEEEMNLLDAVNKFNIKARYPEYKFHFYKQCDGEYAKNYIDKIIKLYKKLLVLIKS